MSTIAERLNDVLVDLRDFADTRFALSSLDDIREQQVRETADYEARIKALTDKLEVCERQNTDLRLRLETAQGEANLHYQLEDFIANWCSDNDCEPEDTQSLAADIIDNHFDALFGELSNEHKKDWGKKVKWNVEVKVTYTGTIEVEAVDADDAREKANEMCADGEVDSDDLNFYESEVEDVNED